MFGSVVAQGQRSIRQTVASRQHRARSKEKAENRGQRSEVRGQESGAVRTSVTLLGQNIGNTMSIISYIFSVSFAVLFGRISARIKFRVAKSTWPSRRRPNQTSIKFSAMGLRPTDQPPKLVLRKSG